MTKPTTLLLTGLIRLPERLASTIETARRLMAEGVLEKAIVSTWYGEIDKYEGLRPALCAAGFQIVEAPEPQKETVGNIWPQMIAYANGLVQVETPYVLKSRPDVLLAERVYRRLTSDIPRKEDRGLSTAPFVDRVWAPWMVISRPFYIADECFFAALEDAWLLHNMDLNYDSLGVDGGISHMRRFIHPFRHHEEANLLFARYADAGFKTNTHYSRLQGWLKDPDYVRILSWYYAIMRRCFDIYCEPGDLEFRAWPIPIPRAKPDVIPLVAQFNEPIDMHCHDDCFIDAIAEGKYDREPLGRALSAGIKEYEMAVGLDGTPLKLKSA